MVTGSLSRDAGGLFESVRALGKSVSNLGVEVGVYGLRDKNWRMDEEAWRPLHPKAFSYKGPRAIAWAPEIDVALEKAQLDVLHLHGLWQYPSIATRRQWNRHQTPYVISPRGMLDPWALRNSRWKKWLAGQFFENAVLRDAACLHALCDSEADSMRAYGLTQRIEVIPNGVDLPELLTTIEQRGRCEIEQLKVGPKGEEAGATESKSTEGVKRLLFLGRIHPKKGLVNALKAWADIQNPQSQIHNAKQWQFVIAGWDQGGHEAELKALCVELGLRTAMGFSRGGTESTEGQNLKLNSYKLKTTSPEWADVIFFGPAFGEEKEALLRSADAFILPSLSEGLPMSVLEAWAYRLPVLMTAECNLTEGFSAGAAIPLPSFQDHFQFTGEGIRAISTLLEMSDRERAQMGKRGRALVEEKFTWPKVAKQLHEIYHHILD